jgi:hypothetical protein
MMPDTPDPFPQPTLNTQRALCAIEASQPDRIADCFTALYQAFWVEGKTIGKPEVFGPVLAKVIGEDGAKAAIEKMGQPEAKKRLSENSDKAMEEGAFGLPWFVATNSEGVVSAWLRLDVGIRSVLIRSACAEGNLLGCRSPRSGGGASWSGQKGRAWIAVDALA